VEHIGLAVYVALTSLPTASKRIISVVVVAIFLIVLLVLPFALLRPMAAMASDCTLPATDLSNLQTQDMLSAAVSEQTVAAGSVATVQVAYQPAQALSLAKVGLSFQAVLQSSTAQAMPAGLILYTSDVQLVALDRQKGAEAAFKWLVPALPDGTYSLVPLVTNVPGVQNDSSHKALLTIQSGVLAIPYLAASVANGSLHVRAFNPTGDSASLSVSAASFENVVRAGQQHETTSKTINLAADQTQLDESIALSSISGLRHPVISIKSTARGVTQDLNVTAAPSIDPLSANGLTLVTSKRSFIYQNEVRVCVYGDKAVSNAHVSVTTYDASGNKLGSGTVDGAIPEKSPVEARLSLRSFVNTTVNSVTVALFDGDTQIDSLTAYPSL
jgi:hypothetical protein